jgi:hypothetical protein
VLTYGSKKNASVYPTSAYINFKKLAFRIEDIKIAGFNSQGFVNVISTADFACVRIAYSCACYEES